MDMSPFFFGLYKFVKYGVYPMSWIIGCIATALVLAWLPYSPRRQQWRTLVARCRLPAPISDGSPYCLLFRDEHTRRLVSDVPAASRSRRCHSGSWRRDEGARNTHGPPLNCQTNLAIVPYAGSNSISNRRPPSS